MFALNSLVTALERKELYEEAAAEFREAIRLRPDEPQAHFFFGRYLDRHRKLDEAVAEFREAIRLKPDDTSAHYFLGTALLTQGKLDEAIAEYRRAQALARTGTPEADRSARRLAEVERLVALVLRLPAVLRGDDRPKDTEERLDFAWLCKSRNLNAASARFYAEALDAHPEMADNDRAEHVYNGACSAALAGCGQCDDDPPPDDAARSRLRGRALVWLKAELDRWSKLLDSSKSAGRTLARDWLQNWKLDPDLAGVRGPDALAKLPESERTGWTAL